MGSAARLPTARPCPPATVLDFRARLARGRARAAREGKCWRDAEGILSILETHHKVVDVSDHVGLSPQPGFDHPLEPEVEYIMQVHVAQHDADRTALWGSLLVWIDLAVFQDACLQPAPDQADHARIADAVLHDAVLHEAEHPFVTETPEEILQVRLQHPAHLAAGDHLVEGCQGMAGSPFRPSAK